MLAILAQGGPWGILVLVMVAIITGRLIPRWTHLQRVQDLKQNAADYRAALGTERERGDELRAQMAILLGSRAREPL